MGDAIINLGSGTSVTDAWHNQFEASKWEVDRYNKDSTDKYRAHCYAFNMGLQNGIEHHPENYPKVPGAYKLDPPPPVDGSEPDYYVYYVQGDRPVCDEVPMWSAQPRVKPGNVDIGPQDASNPAYYDAGPNDGVVNGQIILGPDGRRYQKIGSMMGQNKITGAQGGWYLVMPDAAIQTTKVG